MGRNARRAVRLAAAVWMLASAEAARAVDLGVAPTKLVVVDKLTSAGRAKVVYVAKDAAVTKGPGTDAGDISATVNIRYADGSAGGSFVLPLGANWLANKPTVAKFVNKLAPAGPSEAKVAIVKPGKLVKLVGKGLGDTPFDILGAGDPAGAVYVSYCVLNEDVETCMCSSLTGCSYTLIAGDTGAKLVCRTGVPDPTCQTKCFATSGTLCDLGNGTIVDSSTGLQWEKKNGADSATPGFDVPDPANPHDVDNVYSWAGECTLNPAKLCQPTAFAEFACQLQTDPGYWSSGCETCGVGEGTCNVDAGSVGALDTVWNWVAGLVTSGFAGHDDWRLATTAGDPPGVTGEPAEMETIVDPAQGYCGGGSGACIDPIFGPTSELGYWTATTDDLAPTAAWDVSFAAGIPIPSLYKASGDWVRAVRDTN